LVKDFQNGSLTTKHWISISSYFWYLKTLNRLVNNSIYLWRYKDSRPDDVSDNMSCGIPNSKHSLELKPIFAFEVTRFYSFHNYEGVQQRFLFSNFLLNKLQIGIHSVKQTKMIISLWFWKANFKIKLIKVKTFWLHQPNEHYFSKYFCFF